MIHSRPSASAVPRSPAADLHRLKLRDAFFSQLSLRELLRPFSDLPGIHYVVKDAQSRVMATCRESVRRMGFEHEEQLIGLTPHEYVSPELARKYVADDRWVITHGQPRLNMVEIWFNAQGKRDLTMTSKYPLRNARGQVIGVIGILQNLSAWTQHLHQFGPAGKAAAYIRAHLSEPIAVPEIARRAGVSERQLQRHFRRVFDQSVQQFIISTRIQAASDALTQSDRSIADIAQSLGFNDQSAFSNAFRAHTGFTPRAYRQQKSGLGLAL